MITKAFKIYGAEGHRQAVSFRESVKYDWSEGENVRIVELINSDITGTNDYTIIKITRNTEKEVMSELNGQVSDGLFENYRTGRIEEY